MGPPAAPFSLEVLAYKLIQARPAPARQSSAGGSTAGGDGGSVAPSSRSTGLPGGGPAGRTELSAFDQINAFLATARCYGFGPGSCLDAWALEHALRATVTDLPFLAGRMGRMRGHRLSTLAIEHTNEGALFTHVEAEEVSLSVMAPDRWPQRRMAPADQSDLAFYLEPMDTGRAMLMGREPLMKVRLTDLKDGQILGITLSHAILDGVRWPALEAHLGARYRQFSTPGRPRPDPALLLRPGDRTLLSSAHVAEQLLGEQASTWSPPPLRIRATLCGYWRLACQALAAGRRNTEFLMLYLPRAAAAQLKALAAQGSRVPGITTGDAIQAATALLLHAALGRPLLPVAPKRMAVMVQVPTPEGYFGNAVRMLDVSLPAGTAQPLQGDAAGALAALAGAIRQATAAFRSQPELALEAMATTEALVGAPLLRMLSHMVGVLQPHITSVTNYNPQVQSIDLGLGAPVFTRQVSMPRARDIAIIRPAVPPFEEGLFIQVCMHPKAAERLRRLPLLEALMPDAMFVGGDAVVQCCGPPKIDSDMFDTSSSSGQQ